MLVFSLRKGEEVRAGDVVVKVLGYRGGQLRLGFEAPAGVPVERAAAPAIPAEQGVAGDGLEMRS